MGGEQVRFFYEYRKWRCRFYNALMLEAVKQEGLERPEVRRDPVTGQWKYVTSKDMLEMEAARPKVEREVKQLQEWAAEQTRRQRQVVIDGLREQIRRRNE